MGTTTLDRMKPGEKGRVLQMDVKGLMRRRLYDMGITPGTEITFKKRAPLGDPLEVHLRGYALSLRISEASLVNMEMPDRAVAEEVKK